MFRTQRNWPVRLHRGGGAARDALELGGRLCYVTEDITDEALQNIVKGQHPFLVNNKCFFKDDAAEFHIKLVNNFSL